jgi:uncharacterized protein YfaQ (DUF2300 family)
MKKTASGEKTTQVQCAQKTDSRDREKMIVYICGKIFWNRDAWTNTANNINFQWEASFGKSLKKR